MTDPSGPSDPIEVARSYLASFADRDPDAIAAHVSDDFVNEHTAALGSSCEGRDEYLRRLPGFLDSMPGLRYEIERASFTLSDPEVIDPFIDLIAGG